MRTIAIENLKGGVGKTVTTISLAHILVEEYHQRVMVVDCDGTMQSHPVLSRRGAGHRDFGRGPDRGS